MDFFRSYMKALIWAVVGAFMVGSMLGYFGNNTELHMAVEVRNSVNGGYVENPTIDTFPKSAVAYSGEVAGKGRNILNVDTTWFMFVKANAKGYKTGWTIVRVEPEKRIRVYLDKKEQSKQKVEIKKEDLKIQQPETPMQVKEFWNKLKSSF